MVLVKGNKVNLSTAVCSSCGAVQLVEDMGGCFTCDDLFCHDCDKKGPQCACDRLAAVIGRRLELARESNSV